MTVTMIVELHRYTSTTGKTEMSRSTVHFDLYHLKHSLLVEMNSRAIKEATKNHEEGVVNLPSSVYTWMVS